MGAFSDYLETALLNHLFRATAYTAPASLYISLHTAAPDESGTPSNEVSGGSYARVAVTSNTTNWTAPTTSGAGKLTDNGAVITFPTPSATWGTVSYFGIYDASTAGNLLFYGPLTISKTINSGDTVQFAIGALDIILD